MKRGNEMYDNEDKSYLIGHYSKIHQGCFFPSNRVNMLYRVGQTWTVDMVSRIIDSRMQWQKDNKSLIFGKDKAAATEQRLLAVASTNNSSKDPINRIEDNYQESNYHVEEKNSDDEGEDSDDGTSDDESEEGNETEKRGPVYKKTFLSESMHGSRRYLKKKAMNGLAVAVEYGKSTIFLTLTTNVKWEVLVDALPPGQTAYDNPLITNRIFKKKWMLYCSIYVMENILGIVKQFIISVASNINIADYHMHTS